MFYDQLQKLCRERGEKISPVCQKLNISAGTIGNWRNGGVPNGETLIKFAEYFGVSTDYLLGLSEQKQQKNNFEIMKTEENEENNMDIQEIKAMFEKQNQAIEELKTLVLSLQSSQPQSSQSTQSSQSSPELNPASGENKK